MFIESINIILIIFLVIIQSIIGIGVLVLGTPILLLLHFSIIDTINILLPISIMTSLTNIIILKAKNNLFYDFDRLKSFFKICLPFVLVGLIILKYSYKFINFDYVVSFIIIFTLILRKNISKILKKLSIKLKSIILMIIGIIHGMTNSGGSLLSIILMNLNNSKKESRSEITIFYFLLALVQFILFYLIFNLDQNIIDQLYKLTIYVIIGVVIGNLLLKFTKEALYREIVYILAFISSISLILKNII